MLKKGKNLDLSKEKGSMPIAGGVPFTGFKDWLSGNRTGIKKQSADPRVIILENKGADEEVIRRSLKKLGEIHQDIFFSFYSIKKFYKPNLLTVDYDRLITRVATQKMTSGNLFSGNKKGEVKLILVNIQRVYKFLFARSGKCPTDKFRKILDDFQYIYNLVIIGEEDEGVGLALQGGKRPYVPINSYPNFYGCVRMSLLEKIKFESGADFCDSLLPAASLNLFANYCTFKSKVDRKTIFINSEILGYDTLKNLGIKHKYTSLINKKKAVDFYEKNAKDGGLLVLRGATRSLHYSAVYKFRENVSDRSKAYIAFDTTALVMGPLGKNPIIYSPTIGYFGRIPKNNFFEYWENKKVKGGEKKLAGASGKQFAADLVEISPNRKYEFKALACRLLDLNVKEFYRNKILSRREMIVRNSNGFYGDRQEIVGMEKAYFGRQVLPLYKKDILKSMVDGEQAISDAVIADMMDSLKKPFIFMREFLRDLHDVDAGFSAALAETEKIVGKFMLISEKFKGEISGRGVDYNKFIRQSVYRVQLSDDGFLSGETKMEAVSILEEIIALQDGLFASLRDSLKNKL